MKGVFRYFYLFLVMLSSGALGQSNSVHLLPANPWDSVNSHQVLWETQYGIRYELQRSTSLTNWTTVPGYPAVATSFSDSFPFNTDANAGFFKIVEYDEQPPAVTERSPKDGAFAVRRFSSLTAELADRSAIDPASITLTVGGLGAFTVTDGQLSITSNTITFDSGGDVALGAYGDSVPVTLTVADIHGYTSTNSWSFDLEVEPVVADNLFVFGSPDAQRSGQQIGAIPTRLLASKAAGGPVRMAAGTDPWELQSVESDRIIVSYSGASAPSFSIGDYLANLTPKNVNEIFYRKISGISDDPANQQLTLFTSNVLLEEIVEEGSITVAGDSVVMETDVEGTFTKAFQFDASLTLPPVGFSLDGTSFTVTDSGYEASVTREDIDFAISDSGYDVAIGGLSFSSGEPKEDGWADGTGVRFNADEFHWWLYPVLETSFEIKRFKMTRFKAIASGWVESALVCDVDLLVSSSYTKTIFDLPDPAAPSIWVCLGYIGGTLPIYVEISVDMTVDTKLNADMVIGCSFGFRQEFGADFGVNYTKEDGVEWIKEYHSSPTDVEPFNASIEGELGVGLSLKPRVELLVYGQAGVATGPTVSGEINFKYDCENGLVGALEASADWELELSGPLFELLDPKPSLDPMEIWNDKWQIYPRIINPKSLSRDYGETVEFSCAPLSGLPATYQWYYNDGVSGSFDRVIKGANSSTYVISDFQKKHKGKYCCRINEGESARWTDYAYLNRQTRIPGETNSDNVTFYMDQYETTKAQWDAVSSWAITNGYSFDNVGTGKAANHPVHTVNWYDCVKWCNARSEMENRVPCYRVNGSTFKAGQILPDLYLCANGYRLPTSTEWEYAARGGSGETLYPWGNEITYANANYYLGLDGSPGTEGFHPIYCVGDFPYTSPVGSFPENGYGLYDMIGNVSEWCDTASESYGYFRSGSWMDYAYDELMEFGLRCSFEGRVRPSSASDTCGFRTVSRP